MQFEELAGLPAEGPLAKHYHLGNPTPWSESYVVRLTTSSGETWVGNFKFGHSYYSQVILWREAQLFVVIVGGACYLVSGQDADKYDCHQTTATGALFNEDQTKLFVADYTSLYAYDLTGSILWVHKNLGADGIDLTSCTAGFIEGSACLDPPEIWVDFRLAEADGKSV